MVVNPDKTAWNDNAEVLIVGFGGAGATEIQDVVDRARSTPHAAAGPANPPPIKTGIEFAHAAPIGFGIAHHQIGAGGYYVLKSHAE